LLSHFLSCCSVSDIDLALTGGTIMDDSNVDDAFVERVLAIAELRKAALKQVIYGALWWAGSSIAMAIALGSTADGIFWFGGALGALFHWYRAAKMFKASWDAGFKKVLPVELVATLAIAVLVIVSSLLIVPEYSKTATPQVGTCWGDSGSGTVSPIACWAPAATDVTVGYSTSAENCPSSADGYFDPSASEPRFTCLASK
jgi:hypothetical protein